MRLRSIILTGAALGLIFAVVPARAEAQTQTATYYAPSGVAGGYGASYSIGNAGIGGVTFHALSAMPLRASVKDQISRQVPFEACQDLNNDGICGDPKLDARLISCGPDLDLTTSETPFRPDVLTHVSVGIACGPGIQIHNEDFAITGVVTLTYASSQ
jgi:hypothetical protein